MYKKDSQNATIKSFFLILPTLSLSEQVMLHVEQEMGERPLWILPIPSWMLAISTKSVEACRSRTMKKLGFASSAELVRQAVRERIATP
ncbi:MAG: hypothetical protein ABSA83_14065 [Verrucomicrobiota bacterium]